MGQRIVIASLGSYGDVNPYIGLAVGLQQRGHRVTIATSPFYRPAVEQEGIAFRAVRPDVDPNDRQILRRAMNARTGTEFIIRELIGRHLRESYEDLDDACQEADLLVTHPITFAGPIVAAARNLKWVSTVLAPMSLFSAHDLPVFPNAPWIHRFGQLGLRARRLLVWLSKQYVRSWSGPVYDLRRELGLTPGQDPVFEGQHAPRLVLALFSQVMAKPQPDWPPNVHITGPIFYDGVSSQNRVSPDLFDFLDAGPPPLVFTLGSSAVHTAGEFFVESLQAARMLGQRALLLAGRPPQQKRLRLQGTEVKVVEFAPHCVVFPRAAAIVHQGGIGTSMQALRAGKPTLVVPFAHDQPDNAHRIQKLGVSRTIYPQHYRAKQVAKTLNDLLDDPSFAKRAATVGQSVGNETGLSSACQLIEYQLG